MLSGMRFIRDIRILFVKKWFNMRVFSTIEANQNGHKLSSRRERGIYNFFIANNAVGISLAREMRACVSKRLNILYS